MNMLDNVVQDAVAQYTAHGQYPEEWDLAGLETYLADTCVPMGLLFENPEIQLPEPFKPAFKQADIEDLTKDSLAEEISQLAHLLYEAKEQMIGETRFREIERIIMLRTIDTKWMDHIDAMDQLKQGIGLRAMGNEDPVRSYQIEGFDMFEELIKMIQLDTVKGMFHIQVETEEKIQREQVAKEAVASHGGDAPEKKVIRRAQEKIGRNELCPCGSGKKYKHCCGQEA